MTFEHELVNLDPERLERAVGSIEDEIKRGRDAATLLTPELETKYEKVHYFVDTLGETLAAEAERGQIDGEIAHAMTVGARLAIIALTEYAEAEAFEQKFQ